MPVKVLKRGTCLSRWRMVSRVVTAGFETWRLNAKMRRSQRQTATKVVKRMQALRCLAAFGCWQDTVTELREMRHKMRMVVSRLQVASALSCWRHNGREQGRLVSVGTKILLQIKNAQLSRSLSAWTVEVADRRKWRHTTLVVIRRLQGRLMASCLAGRRANVELLHRAAAVMSRLQCMKVLGCFNAWSMNAPMLRQKRQSLIKVLRRMQDRSKAASFCVWWKAAGELGRSKRVVGPVLQRMQNAAVAMCLAQWRDNAHDHTLDFATDAEQVAGDDDRSLETEIEEDSSAGNSHEAIAGPWIGCVLQHVAEQRRGIEVGWESAGPGGGENARTGSAHSIGDLPIIIELPCPII
jgi:hypothetical protein